MFGLLEVAVGLTWGDGAVLRQPLHRIGE
jgi:enoyl-CoA hydratase/carnithine racemase